MSAMEWLIAGIFATTAMTVLISLIIIRSEQKRGAEAALAQGAAQFGLRPSSWSRWTGARTFDGSVRGFEMKWALTPRRGGRQIEVVLAHPELVARQLPEGSRDGFPCTNPHVSFKSGTLTLRFIDVIGDLGELAPCTHRLLALAETLRSGQPIHTLPCD
jgi:hypothetical protein